MTRYLFKDLTLSYATAANQNTLHSGTWVLPHSTEGLLYQSGAPLRKTSTVWKKLRLILIKAVLCSKFKWMKVDFNDCTQSKTS